MQAEETGRRLQIRIVPTFGGATAAREHAHLRAEVACAGHRERALLEWGDRARAAAVAEYVKHEYRVQYMETDFPHLALVEEAGITYFFEFDDASESTSGGTKKTKLVLTDTPGNGPSRGAPLPFVEGHTTEGRKDFVTKVRVTTHVRSGHFAVRDFDFRLKPDYKLFQEHKDGIDRELKPTLSVPARLLLGRVRARAAGGRHRASTSRTKTTAKGAPAWLSRQSARVAGSSASRPTRSISRPARRSWSSCTRAKTWRRSCSSRA